MQERLQKLISAAGIASRREAEQMILGGRVSVNGATAALGQRADPSRDEIRIDGKPLPAPPEKRYIMLNKPRGYVSTVRDDRGRRTVMELVRDAGGRLYPVGRLDYDSEGLLLLTNDGALTHALTHPSHAVNKTYRTRVSGDLASALPVLRAPMLLEDGVVVGPAAVRPIGEGLLEITIHEGRNRQVRRMCALAGLEVLRLTRVSEGPLHLGSLASGTWRFLEENEIKAVRNLI